MNELLKTLLTLSSAKNKVITIQGREIQAHRYQDHLSLLDITDGCKPGKLAVKASISLPDEYTLESFQTALEWFNIVLDMAMSNEWPEGKQELVQTVLGLRCSAYRVKTNRICNPANLKPLTEIPAKWTIRHVARVLSNRQYTPNSLHCDGKYSDDYYGDAQNNYGKGPVSPEPIVRDLIESPSGYWVRMETLENGSHMMRLACHQFLYYSFQLNSTFDKKPV